MWLIFAVSLFACNVPSELEIVVIVCKLLSTICRGGGGATTITRPVWIHP